MKEKPNPNQERPTNMETPKTYYRLTCDVENPLFDRRNAYGIKSVKVFKKGQIFQKFLSDTIGGIDVYHLRLRTKKLSETFRFEEFSGNLEVSEPTELEKYFADFGGECSDYYLERAIKDGLITNDQLLKWRSEIEN